MSLDRRLRRESARQQAQQRVRRMLASRRRRTHRPQSLRKLPAALFRMKTLAVIAALGLAAIIAVPVFAPGAAPSAPPPEPAATPTPESRILAAPAMQVTPGSRYMATIQTSRGTIRAQLLPEDAPAAVNNIVYLSRNQFYNGLAVNRVEPGQRVELGGSGPEGSGGPGYTVPLDPSPRPLRLGSLIAMDQGGGMGSRFAIVLSDALSAAPGPVFGQITDGLDIARQLQAGDRIQSIGVAEIEAPGQ